MLRYSNCLRWGTPNFPAELLTEAMMVIATRVLRLEGDNGEVAIPIRVYAPEREDNAWSCRYQIDWPEGTQDMKAGGVESMQAHNRGKDDRRRFVFELLPSLGKADVRRAGQRLRLPCRDDDARPASRRRRQVLLAHHKLWMAYSLSVRTLTPPPHTPRHPMRGTWRSSRPCLSLSSPLRRALARPPQDEGGSPSRRPWRVVARPLA